MAPFKDSFDQYENENYFDTFLKDNNDQKKYFYFRPLVEDKKLYRDFNQDNPQLKDADLEKAVLVFQGIDCYRILYYLILVFLPYIHKF